MDITSLGYRTDLALLQLGGTQVEDRGDHLVLRSPHNPTFWWGNFLLLSQVPAAADTDRWLERFAAEFPDAEHVALGFDGVDGQVADLASFTERGMHCETSTVMTATAVHEPPRPNDRRQLSPADVRRGLGTERRAAGGLQRERTTRSATSSSPRCGRRPIVR